MSVPHWPGVSAACISLLISFCLPSPARAAAAEEGLLGSWSFEGSAINIAADASGRHNDAELQNVRRVRGAFGRAIEFVGQNSYAVIPELRELDGSDALTVEVWVLWEGTGKYPNILTGGRWSPGGFLMFVADNTCMFRLGRPGHQSNRPGDQWREISVPLLSPIPMKRWVHLAATFQRPVLTSYVNGKKVGTARWNYPIGCSGDLFVGKWSGAVSHRGLIDELRIYRTARMPAQILADYESTRKGRTTGEYNVVKAAPPVPAVSLETDQAVFSIDPMGRAVSLISKPSGRELLAAPLPLAAARVGGRRHIARRCTVAGGNLRIEFMRLSGSLTLAATAKRGYFRFEVVDTDIADLEELVFFQAAAFAGPYVGTMAGMVSDDRDGLCVRALNLRTDVRLSPRSRLLQARAVAKYGIEGAAIALAAGPKDGLRTQLKTITVQEKQPKSLLGGAWSMDAPELRGSYLFARVSEENVDDWIVLAERGGFQYVHFSGWWRSLGHYEPQPGLFPHGIEGMREAVERIHAAGLEAGMHTLTGCISTNDPWVSPVPDPRLKADASYTLARPMSAADTTIYVKEKPGNHDVVWTYASGGNAVRIGKELISYAAISHRQPYAFLQCTRGAFHSRPAAHPKGVKVDHLQQRYLAFYPDETTTLVDEVADAIANVYNTCAMDQIYMDGSEGMMGWHPVDVMRNAIYARLKRPALIEASCHGHHNWWFHSRLGAWDHAKWAFRQFADMHSRSAGRYRKTDFLEPQMGWWALIGPSAVSRGIFPEEVEYFVSKTMAMDSAMSIQGVTVGARPPNARQEEYFTIIGRWERLRRARYFDDVTLALLGEPGADFHLEQSPDGEWRLAPMRYAVHRVTALGKGSESWTVDNPYPAQRPAWRLEALYGVRPPASPNAAMLFDAADPKIFTFHNNARGVRSSIRKTDVKTGAGEAALAFGATNISAPPKGAWCRVGFTFPAPYRDIRPGKAVGLWVHGDARGEVLNVQLRNPREYHGCFAEHYITIDFTGWRYIAMPFRERDADRYHEYQWPYGGYAPIYRTALDPAHIGGLTLYLNNIPAGESVEVLVGPVRALPITRMRLTRPALTLAGRTFRVPFDLSSGEYAEIDARGEALHFDERGELLARARIEGDLPAARPGANAVAFSCASAGGGAPRAEVTLVTRGKPAGRRRSEKEIDRRFLRREFDLPRVILEQNGVDNVWQTVSRKGERASLEVVLEVLKTAFDQKSFASARALPIESCADPTAFQLSKTNTYARYAYDAESKGVPAKPGVTQAMTLEKKEAKSADGALRYTASSRRADRRGWAAKGRRFDPPQDLSSCSGIGFWLYGDGKGESFKLQLRDRKGKWLDLVTPVDFSGWRFISFSFSRPNLDLSQIEYLIFFYNGIPSAQTVECLVDEVRGLREQSRLDNPTFEIGDARITVPAGLSMGQRLVLTPAGCRLSGPGKAAARKVQARGTLPVLTGGAVPVKLTFAKTTGTRFRVRVGLVKTYQP